ncbi:MAG: type III pantothenate kinase [Campylobacter sp.]
MTLCDIGNTNATFFDGSKITKIKLENFINYKPANKVFFISVNDAITEQILNNKNFINLEKYFELDTIYKGLGVDRVASCYAVENGVVVDAGSAVTIDVMSSNAHLGGMILPGISRWLKSYEEISSRLKVALNSQIELDALPQKTADAISYGIIKSLVLLIQNVANSDKIYLTGGDGEFLSKFFQNSIYDKMLVFRGMQKLIDQKKEILC